MMIIPYYLQKESHKFWQPYSDVFFEEFFLKNINSKKLIFFHPDEYGTIIEDNNFFKKVKQFVINNGIEFELWLGYHYVFHDSMVINWKWWLAHWSYYIKQKYHISPAPQIQNLFTCYNRRQRFHRCLLIDTLYKNNLQDCGYISWHKIDKDSKNFLPYNFQHFNEEKIIYDQLTENLINENGYNIQHESYFNTVFNLVTESEFKFLEISEKTYFSIWHHRPFLIVGSQYIHEYLESLGFKKYPIFDYSFDNFENLEDRIEGIIDNINMLKKKNYENLFAKCIEIANYNKTVLTNICKNDNIKHLFSELYSNNKDNVLLKKYRKKIIW